MPSACRRKSLCPRQVIECPSPIKKKYVPAAAKDEVEEEQGIDECQKREQEEQVELQKPWSREPQIEQKRKPIRMDLRRALMCKAHNQKILNFVAEAICEVTYTQGQEAAQDIGRVFRVTKLNMEEKFKFTVEGLLEKEINEYVSFMLKKTE